MVDGIHKIRTRVNAVLNGPLHDKTYISGFQQSVAQTSLLSYTDYLENWNFTYSKFRYYSFQKANNKGSDQTAWMCRLVWAFVVGEPRRQVLWGRYPNVSVHWVGSLTISELWVTLLCSVNDPSSFWWLVSQLIVGTMWSSSSTESSTTCFAWQNTLAIYAVSLTER